MHPLLHPVIAVVVAVVFGSAAARAQSPPSPLDAAFVDRMEALLAEGKPADALAGLQSREAEFAGRLRFDYLLGLAALDAGRPEVAVPALERVLAVEPRFAGARIELGRAEFEAGRPERARLHFERLLAEDPDPGSRVVIERYLAQIERRAPRDLAARPIAWFVDLGAGYDSNANGSTSDTEFLGFTLNPLDVAQASGFVEAGVGGNWAHNGSPQSAINLYGRLAHRANPDASFVDQSLVLAGANYHRAIGKTRIVAGAHGYNGWLDGRQHQKSGSVELGASRLVGKNVELAALVRSGALLYDQPQFQVLDVNRVLGGVALTRLGLRDGRLRVGAAVLAGRDEARRAGSPFGNERIGGRLFASHALAPQRALYGEVLYLDTRFEGRGFFGRQRIDKQWVAFLGMDWQGWPSKNWIITPQLRVADNRSNVALFSYDRIEAMLFVRRLWQ